MAFLPNGLSKPSNEVNILKSHLSSVLLLPPRYLYNVSTSSLSPSLSPYGGFVIINPLCSEAENCLKSLLWNSIYFATPAFSALDLATFNTLPSIS